VFIFLKDACHILMQSFFPFIVNKSRSIFHCKNKLNMNLGIGICHVSLNLFAKWQITSRPPMADEKTNRHFSTNQMFGTKLQSTE
jgi:hypothetical protein